MPGKHGTTELHVQPPDCFLLSVFSLIPLGSENSIWFNFHLFKFPKINLMAYKVFYLRTSLLVSVGECLNVCPVNELTILLFTM